MEKPRIDPEEWIISLSDVKQLYISIWKRLIKWAVLGALLAVLYFGGRPSKYKAEASFQIGVEKSSTESFLQAFVGGAAADQPQASSIMKSYQVLRPLVEKMGLQIQSPDSEWKIKKIFKRFGEALKAEKGLMLEDLDPFCFQNVCYEEEAPFDFHLSFTDTEHFTLYAADRKQELCKGTLGSEVRLEDPPIQFTLGKAPEKLKTGSFYPFQAVHWASAAGNLRCQIKINTDKDNSALINISILNRNRHLAARLVNELMSQYQFYLKREYDQFANEQLAYLEKKQDQLFGKMDRLFDEHTAYLKQNLETGGFIALDGEVQSFLGPHHRMQDKVTAIEVDLSRLDQIEKEGKEVALVEDSPFSRGVHQIAQKIQELKRQKDLLELSLSQAVEHSLEMRRDGLKEIRDQRYAVEKLLQEVDQGGEISSFDLNQGLCRWARGIRNLEEREDLAEYLENYVRLLSMREKMLQERFFYADRTPSELEGIDLVSANALFLQYNSKLDAAEAAMRHYEQFKKEIHRPDFELASLSSVLKDTFCQQIISDAISTGVRLKDEKYHTSKEAGRWAEEIAFQKKILSDHLDQLYQVEELNASLIRKKMTDLQRVSLDCINRQLSVLHEQTNDSLKEQRQVLLLEKALLGKKIEEIRSSLSAGLPEKWRFEQWLRMKTLIVEKVIDTVTQAAESKSLAAHLHRVESRPLDRALVPTAPLSPRLHQMAYLGAIALPFFIFCLAFLRQILKGFPASLEKLKALHLPVLGPISAFCDGPSVETPTGPDLELLRRLAIFSEEGVVIGLIGGRGPDYSYALGENLARMSMKLIVVRCDFLSKFRKEDCPGLLQIWKGETAELPVRKGNGFDYITTGGYSSFGTEVIQSQNFADLIQLFKKKYDRVFLLFRSPLASAESTAALRLCDKAVVTVSEEQIEELTPFVNWAYHENHCRLTFITRS